LNLNALAATGRTVQLEAENVGDVLLQIGQIGGKPETEKVVRETTPAPGIAMD
jgi:hypothetical protein